MSQQHLKIENPWRRLPKQAPYVLPEDAAQVRDFNKKAGEKELLRVDEILPEPFIGRRDAPLVLLSNNPGFTEKGLSMKQDQGFTAKLRKNLLHERLEYPFIFLDSEIEGSGKRWWWSKLKYLGFDERTVANSVLNVPYFPYPSQRYGHAKLQLPSQSYSFHLVREAIKRNAAIVLMRKRKPVLRGWFEGVPGLERYGRLFCVRNTQNPVISPGNCDGYRHVVEAIMPAR